jgi:hypothetical protein
MEEASHLLVKKWDQVTNVVSVKLALNPDG